MTTLLSQIFLAGKSLALRFLETSQEIFSARVRRAVFYSSVLALIIFQPKKAQAQA